jgi:type VI secretion system protein ImpA
VSDSEHPHASPATFDVAALLEPISPDAPAGTDLRADESGNSPYYRIKDARNAARAAERLLEKDPANAPPADWSPVLDMAPDLLQSSAKDLEVVAWYIEALVREHGVAGLRDGFALANGICERYWDSLWPAPGDGEGAEVRAAPIAGLNGDSDSPGTLAAPIRRVPITEGSSVGPFTVWEYEQAVEVEKLADPEAKQRRFDGGATPLADVRRAVSETSVDFFRRFRDDVAQTRAEFSKLCDTLTQKAADASPPASNIRNALERLHDTLGFLTADIRLDVPVEATDAAAAPSASSGAASVATAASGVAGPIRTRDEAFRRLEQVADYFRATEPHSPLAYTLLQAVRWGKMPLPDLLAELIPDEQARLGLFKLTGIRPPDSSAEA